ncbi:MAG: pantetheine-phosphate adenylyltransferase [Anaerolineae bacterium]
MKRVAVYPGSFDPIHLGHMDIARRAAKLFDRLIVAVYSRPNKRLLFTAQERVVLAREALRDVPNIEVQPYGGLTTEFAESVGARVLVRGLRVISDFEMEYQMALTNKQLAPEIETICLMTRDEYAFLTGSIVKEIYMLGGDVSSLVLPHVLRALERKRDQSSRPDQTIEVVSIRD